MPSLTTIGAAMGKRALKLEQGYASLYKSTSVRRDLEGQALAAEAKKGLTFLDEFKKNLYGFSQELNRIPYGLETARVAVQRSVAPAMEAVLTRAENHLASLKLHGMERKRPGAMGAWYNPLDWADDAADAVQGAVVKTALLGLAIYAGVKMIESASEKSK